MSANKGSLLLSAAAHVGPNQISKKAEITSNVPVYADNTPFQNLKATGKYFTDYRSSGATAMNMFNRSRTQLQNNDFRGFMSSAGGPTQSVTNSVVGNQQKNYGVVGSDLTCNADIDCNYSAGFKGTCNVAHQGWNDFNKGYQPTGYCYFNADIEFEGGKYNRHSITTTGDGIGQRCSSHSDCSSAGKDWFCRGSDEPGVKAENGLDLPPAFNEFGSGNQVGYCAQVQSTVTKKGPKNYWIEYGNHSKPTVPRPDQNRGGKGYKSYNAANNALMPGQTIYHQQHSDRWFCTYPIKAPFPANLRDREGSTLTSLTQPGPRQIKRSIQLEPLWNKNRASIGMGGGGRY